MVSCLICYEELKHLVNPEKAIRCFSTAKCKTCSNDQATGETSNCDSQKSSPSPQTLQKRKSTNSPPCFRWAWARVRWSQPPHARLQGAAALSILVLIQDTVGDADTLLLPSPQATRQEPGQSTPTKQKKITSCDIILWVFQSCFNFGSPQYTCTVESKDSFKTNEDSIKTLY